MNQHHCNGQKAMATSTSSHATQAALDVMDKGGNAVDAYISAALVQCVVEHGSTSLGGAFGINYFNASSRETSFVFGGIRGATADEYDEGYSYKSPEALGGRGMGIPGFIEGVRAAHQKDGKLPWQTLFEWAIHYADEGFEMTPTMYLMTSMSDKSCRYPEGTAIWMNDGRYCLPGERIKQPALAKTLNTIAQQGAEAFYEGEFAEHFIERAKALGGQHTLADMKARLHSAETQLCPLEGDYRGHQFIAPLNGLSIYAMHLIEAANVRSIKTADSIEAVYTKIRIAEEILHTGKNYNPDSHAQFVSKAYAQQRIDFVLNSPVRPTHLDLLFKTNFLAIRDNSGNVAWQTHTINCPEVFGAGIVVDGVYLSYITNRAHAKQGDLTAGSGTATCFALYKEGKPAYIAGSPGFGWFHGPYQVMTNMVEFGMPPLDAVQAPRFGLGSASTFNKTIVEGHHTEAVFTGLENRGIDYQRVSPSRLTGVVGAMHLKPDGFASLAQDPRRDGLALAK